MSSSPSAVLFLGYAVDAEMLASVVYDREKKKFLKRSDVDVDDDDDDDDDVVDDWDNLFDGYCGSMKSLDPSWEKTFSVCNLRYEDEADDKLARVLDSSQRLQGSNRIDLTNNFF